MVHAVTPVAPSEEVLTSGAGGVPPASSLHWCDPLPAPYLLQPCRCARRQANADRDQADKGTCCTLQYVRLRPLQCAERKAMTRKPCSTAPATATHNEVGCGAQVSMANPNGAACGIVIGLLLLPALRALHHIIRRSNRSTRSLQPCTCRSTVYHAIFGGTQNVSCIRRSFGCARRHCRPFAAIVMMNTRLPTAVADTRWCGRMSFLMSTSLRTAHGAPSPFDAMIPLRPCPTNVTMSDTCLTSAAAPESTADVMSGC